MSKSPKTPPPAAAREPVPAPEGATITVDSMSASDANIGVVTLVGSDFDTRQPLSPPAPPLRPAPPRRIRITHYKVKTSGGRAIAGDVIELPDDEASVLIAEGHAVDAPVSARR